MKKTIIGMVVGMVIMSCAGFIGYMSITKSYDAKLENTKAEYEAQISNLEDKYNNLEKSNSVLEEQVYNMMNGYEYSFSVQHDGGNYHYSCKNNGKGKFDELKTYVKDMFK